MSTPLKENSFLNEMENSTFNNADNIGNIMGDVRFLRGIEKICKTFFMDERKNDPMQREVTRLNEKITEILEQVKLVNSKVDFLTTLFREKESSCSCKKTTVQIERSHSESIPSTSSKILAGVPLNDPLANPIGQKLIHDTLDNLTDTDFPELLQEMINDKGGISGMKEKKNIDKINTDDFSNDIMRNYLQFKSDVAGDAILRRNGNEKKQRLREEREKQTFPPPKKHSPKNSCSNLIISSIDIQPTTSKILEDKESEVVQNKFSENIVVFPGQHAGEELAVSEASDNPNSLNENKEGLSVTDVPIKSREPPIGILSKKSADKIAKVSKPIMKRKTGEKLQTLKKAKKESCGASRKSSPRTESQVQSYLDILNALPLTKRVSKRKNFEPKTLYKSVYINTLYKKSEPIQQADESTSVCHDDRSVSTIIHGLLNQVPLTNFQTEYPRSIQPQSQPPAPSQEEFILVPVDTNHTPEPNIIYTDVTDLNSSKMCTPGRNSRCFNDFSDYMRRPSDENQLKSQVIRLQENQFFQPKTKININQAEKAVQSRFNPVIKEPGLGDNSYAASSSNELETMDLFSSDALPPPENPLTLDVPRSTTPPQKTFPDELMGVPSESNPTPLNLDFLKNLKTPSKTIDFSNSSFQKPAKRSNAFKTIPTSSTVSNSECVPPQLIYTSSEERLGASVQAMADDFDNFELPISHCHKTPGQIKLKSSSESLIPLTSPDQSETSTGELELPPSVVKPSEVPSIETLAKTKRRKSRKPLIIRKVKSEELTRKESQAFSKRFSLENPPIPSSPSEIRSIEEAAIGLLMCQSSMKKAAENSVQKEKTDSKFPPSTTVTAITGVKPTLAACNQIESEKIEKSTYEEKVMDKNHEDIMPTNDSKHNDERKTPLKACDDTEAKEAESQSKQSSLNISTFLSPNTLDYLWNSTIINTPLLQEQADSKQTPSPSAAYSSEERSSSQEARVETVKVDLFNAKEERCVDQPTIETIPKCQKSVLQSSEIPINDQKLAEVPDKVGQSELSLPKIPSSDCTLGDRKTTDTVVSGDMDSAENYVNISDVESQSANEMKKSKMSLSKIVDNKEPLQSHISPEIKERKADITDSDEESDDSRLSESESSEHETSEEDDSDSEWIDISGSESTPGNSSQMSPLSNYGNAKKTTSRKKTVLRRRKKASNLLKKKKKSTQVLSIPTRKAMTVMKPKELKRLNESKELENEGQIGKNRKSLDSKNEFPETTDEEFKKNPKTEVGTFELKEKRETLNDAEETEIPSVICMITSPENNAGIPDSLEPTSSEVRISGCESVFCGDTTCYDSTADDEESADETTDTESIGCSDATQDDVFEGDKFDLKEKPPAQTIIKVRTISSESSPKELGKSSDLQPTLETLASQRKDLSKKKLSKLVDMNAACDTKAEIAQVSKNKNILLSGIWSLGSTSSKLVQSHEIDVKKRRKLKEWDRPSLHQNQQNDDDSFDRDLRSYARKRKHSSFSDGHVKDDDDAYCLVSEVKKRRDKLEADRMNSQIPEAEAQPPDLSQLESPPGYDSSVEEDGLNSTIDSNATFDLGDDADCAPRNSDTDINDKEEGELSEMDVSKENDDHESRLVDIVAEGNRHLSPRNKENIDALLIEAGLDLSMDSLMDDSETLTESKNNTEMPMESSETNFAPEVKSSSSKEKQITSKSPAKERIIADKTKLAKIENDKLNRADRCERRRPSREISPGRGRNYRRESERSRSRYSRENSRRHGSRERRNRRRESSVGRRRNYSSRDSSSRRSRGTSRRGSHERQENCHRRSRSRRASGVHSRIEDNDKSSRSKRPSKSAGGDSISQNNQKTKTKESQ